MKQIELVEKRKNKEKHFLQEDGSIVAIMYSDDVHYKKDGKYKEIDNTLIEEEDYYSNKNNDYKVRFKKKSKDALMQMEKDNHYLNIRLKNSNESQIYKKRNSSKYVGEVSYSNIFDGIDIDYQTLPTKVKETIILHDNRIKDMTFIVDTNLKLELEHGCILAKDNETIFTIEKPYMIDSNGIRNDNIYYEIKSNGNEYEIELILDKEWLLSEETKYPVYIDPTITKYNEENSVYDTYIYEGDADVDRNSRDILKAGVERVDGQDIVNRTLLKFDLPKIGTGSEIIDSTLYLIGYPIVIGDTSQKTATVHRITENWDESTATWENMSTKYDQDRVEAVMQCTRSWYRVDEESQLAVEAVTNSAYLTDLVKKWYKNTPNYGILIKSAKEEYIDDCYPAFFSKNNAAVDYNPKPVLEVTYRNQNGLESYLNYKSQNFTDGSTYINTYNGNLVGIFGLGSTIGGKLPASLNLVYNTNDVIIKENGFKFSLTQTVKEVTLDEYVYLEYEDEDGTIHYFYKDESNDQVIYYDEDGLELKIEKTDTNCTMTDKFGNIKTFTKKSDGNYYLTKIQDISNNEINIELNTNNQITKIIDANNAEITLTYSDNITTITSPDSTTKLNYSGNNITSIETINGTTNFTYNENNLISSITDVTGLKICYEYYSKTPYKTKKVTQYGLNNTIGNYFTLEYGFNTTTITDHKDRNNTLIFNSLGNLLSSNSMPTSENLNDAYSTSETYGDDSFNKNRLLFDTIPVKYVKNYLNNSSFETDEEIFTASYQTGIEKSFSTDYSVSGDRSLKVVTTEDNKTISAELQLNSGKYYTFSGYFKNEQKVKIALIGYQQASYRPEQLIQTVQEFDSSNEFVRRAVTFYHEDYYYGTVEIQITFEGTGTTYIDNIQLEEGEVANNYNIIENSDFSDGLSDWTLEAYTYEDDEEGNPITVPTSDVFEVVNINNNQNTALKVKMNPLHYTSFNKTFPIKGKKGDVYNVSFWYKNEGVQGDGALVGGNSVMIYFKPIGHDADYCIMSSDDFNPNEKWQYFSYRYGADEDFESITLDFSQGRNANNLYITNLTFYKDLNTEDYSYDDYGNITSVTDSTDRETVFNYDDNNQLISATSPRGKNYSYEYDNVVTDRVINAISSMGIANHVKYDSFGNPILTKITKKSNDEIIAGTYKIRSKGTDKYLKAEYSSVFVESNDCSNTIWNLEKIDDSFKFIYSVIPNYCLAYAADTTLLSIGNTNNLFVLEKNDNGSYHIKADDKYLKVNGASLEVKELIENDPSFEFYFEVVGEDFIENSATYTEDGRFVTSVTDSLFNKTLYETDSTTGLTTSMTNANNQTTNYTYNDKKQITSITQGDKTVNYTYNNQNQLSKITQGNKEYNFTYDDFLNMKKVMIGDNITLATNEYEGNNGNLLKTTYGNSQEISYDYDEFDRIKTIHKMEGDYNYKYDSNGNIAKILFNNSITTYDTDPIEIKLYDSITEYTYDSIKRIQGYINDNFRINYNYDSNNNVTNKEYRLDDETYTVENTFDKDDNLTKTVSNNQEFNYEYDGLGRLVNKNINNSYNTTYDYVSIGKRTSTLVESIKNGNNKYSYKYDNLNNITHVYYNDVLLKQYYYDDYNELIKEEDYSKNEKIDYIYDNSGNLLTKSYSNLLTNDIINTDAYLYTNTNWEDQLTSYNGSNIIYDAVGNPIIIGNDITMTWIDGRSLNTYTDTSKNLNISYTYNKDGIRVSKAVNDVQTKYYLENSSIVYEQRGDNLIYYLYDLTGLIGLKYNGNVYYYIKNLQGDIIGILDESYNQIVTYEYDSWGKVLSIKDTEGSEITDTTNIGIINPFRYRGYYYDTETKLYYLNSRYYNPEWGRFLNADGILGANKDVLGYNFYAYVSNNPICFNDTDGSSIGAGIIGATIASGIVETIIAITVVAVTTPIILQVALQTATDITREVQVNNTKRKKEKKDKEKTNENDHNVYVLREKDTNIVRYVGRTQDIPKTKKRHKNNPFRMDLELDPVAKNISKETARGLEQRLIEQCRTLNKDPSNPINNQINGLSSKHKYYSVYWDAAVIWNSENFVSCY